MVPSGAVVTLAVEPHFRPSGNRPQLTPRRYGLGRSLWAPRSDAAGSRTGYCPAANTGVARAPPAPPPAALAEAGGAPQVAASGPEDPSLPWALTLPTPAARTTTTAVERLAIRDTRVAPDI